MRKGVCGLLGGIILIGLLGLTTACKATTTTLTLTLSLEEFSYVIDGPGEKDYFASCRPGEQLVSGGYTIYGQAPVVLASYPVAIYPSGPNAWMVHIFDYDDTSDQSLVLVYADCVTTPNYSLGMTLESTTKVVNWNAALHSGQAGTIITATCPAGSSVTGGGWLTSTPPLEDPTKNGYFTGIDASFPATDAAGNMTGWTVDLPVIAGYTGFTYSNPPPDTTTTVGVLCAAQNRLDVHAVKVTRFVTMQYMDSTVPCGAGEVATGGGFATGAGDYPPYSSVAVPDFSGWQFSENDVTLYHYFQEGKTLGRNHWAVCANATIVLPAS
jgi:hypothetical protein